MAEPHPPDTDILIFALWHAHITPKKLPKDVYLYNADKLKQGLYKGYKKNITELRFNSPDYKMLQHLRTNIYMFSAAKTFQQVKEAWDIREKLTAKLTEGDIITPFQDFKKEVEKINEQYNVNWLATEYDDAIAQAQNASSWQQAMEHQKTFPNRTYHTDESETVCEICAPLDGITLPLDDPFWDEWEPQNHDRCNCYCTEEDEEADITGDGDVSDAKEAVKSSMTEEQWKKNRDRWGYNPGKDGEIFNKEHSYFSVPKEYKSFAKTNFGLPIPEHD